MQVTNLIKPSALSVRITEVGVGSVYKRIEKPSYGDERLVFGVVTDVLHDGDKAAIVALEFQPSTYGQDYTPKIRSFSGEADLTIFPATPEEYAVGMAEAIEAQQRTVDTAERDFITKRTILDRMKDAAAMQVQSATTESIEGA